MRRGSALAPVLLIALDMKKLTDKTAPALLDDQALAAATGGDFDGDWCGTRPRPFPFPPRGPIFDAPILDLPVIIVRP